MKIIKSLSISATVIVTSLSFSSVFAVDAQSQAADTKAVATDDMTHGEIRNIDKENSKLTIKHGDIKNLGMPGMTMVFQISDKSMLDSVQPGNRIKFKAVREGGKLVITDMQVIK